MSKEIWATFILPVIQFLIGPIVVGIVIFYLNNRATVKREKEKTVRQLNLHYSKVKRLIQLVEDLNKDLEESKRYEQLISQMNLGDFSSVKTELEDLGGNKHECLQMFMQLKYKVDKSFMETSKEVNSTALELNEIPNDLLPTHIHADIIEIIESKRIDLDLKNHKKLLKNIQKAIKSYS